MNSVVDYAVSPPAHTRVGPNSAKPIPGKRVFDWVKLEFGQEIHQDMAHFPPVLADHGTGPLASHLVALAMIGSGAVDGFWRSFLVSASCIPPVLTASVLRIVIPRIVNNHDSGTRARSASEVRQPRAVAPARPPLQARLPPQCLISGTRYHSLG